MYALKDRTAFVTGAARGLGLAIAEGLAAAGARVCLFDVDGANTEAAASRLAGSGSTVIACPGSVTEPGDIERALEETERVLGPLDIAVNNAGINKAGATLDIPAEEWLEIMEVNLIGVFHCCQREGRRMRERRSGSIVNMASIYGLTHAPQRNAYCVSKAGVVSLTRTLAIELAEHGIRVNAVAPAYVETRMVRDMAAAGVFDMKAVIRRTPLGRCILPHEVADAVCFLCSNAASAVTGHVLGVDGGWTAYGYL